MLVVVRAAFGEIAADIFVDTGITVIGCHELLNLNHRKVTEGFHNRIGKLTGQEVAKKVELGLMSIHGLGMFLLKKVKEIVHKGFFVIRHQV